MSTVGFASPLFPGRDSFFLPHTTPLRVSFVALLLFRRAGPIFLHTLPLYSPVAIALRVYPFVFSLPPMPDLLPVFLFFSLRSVNRLFYAPNRSPENGIVSPPSLLPFCGMCLHCRPRCRRPPFSRRGLLFRLKSSRLSGDYLRNLRIFPRVN